jgi:hypothetical protein
MGARVMRTATVTRAIGLIAAALFAAAAVLFVLGVTRPAAAQQPLPIPKEPGKQCPSGFASGASWCTPMPTTTRRAVSKPKGASCPSGWSESGGACLEPVRR